MKKQYLKLFTGFILVPVFAAAAAAAGAISKLDALSEKLIAGYLAGAKTKTSIAILPLTCDENLSRLKVGFAVSEVVSRKFLASGRFTVIERAALDKVFAEQKLSASGAVSGETSAAFGKITGARLILAGNVLKIGGEYQVNVRLVDTESSEVVGSGYTEIGSAAFEEEARPYLALAPEEQSLSLYFLYNIRNNANDLPETTNNIGGFGTVHTRPASFLLSMLGIGLRYFPAQKIFTDLSVMGTLGRQNAGKADFSPTFSVGTTNTNYSIKTLSFRGLLGYKLEAARGLNVYAALGAAVYSVSGEAEAGYTTPTLQLRGEYRPQDRVGLSLALGYDLSAKTATKQDTFQNVYTPEKYTSKRARLGKFSLEPSVSLYF